MHTDNHPAAAAYAYGRRRSRVSSSVDNTAERFNDSVLDEFFRVKMRETSYGSVETAQHGLDAGHVHYNTERRHLGYRNQGRRPVETINSFVSQEA
jgi:transposase InsO family protein